MFRKVSIVAGAALLVAASLTTTSASAATKIGNGTACSKSGAKTKSGGTSYICAKNPLIKNSKLTWLSTDCLSTAQAYVKSKAALPSAKSQSDKTVADLNAQLAAQQVEADKAAKLIPEYTAKIATINARLATLKADTANLVANKKDIDAFTLAVRNYEAAIKSLSQLGKQTDRIKLQKELAIETYTNAKDEVASGFEMAKLVCTKGY